MAELEPVAERSDIRPPREYRERLEPAEPVEPAAEVVADSLLKP